MSVRPHKIMYVVTGLQTGGAEAMLARLLTAAPRLADDITVVSLLPAKAYVERLRAAGIGVVELDFGRILGGASGLIRLARKIAASQPDIVQGWMYHGDIAALLALVLSGRRRRTQLIWSIRCSELDLARYGLVLRLVVKACVLLSSCPDIVTANSTAGMKSHLALGYRPRRTVVLANGIDVGEFKPDAATRVAFRRELGLAEDAVVIAHVARVDPMKDHENLLRAMAELPKICALVIGAGTENLPPRPNLLRLGRQDNMPRWLAAADFIVSSSAFGEGFSNALAEGMACGLPAIATDVGDAREIVGDTGLIVPPRDHGALAAGIRSLAAEPLAARLARGQRARERIGAHFSLERAVEAWAALYDTISGTNSPNGCGS
jgi:glycosyltransferase involved in cell wall biosynthesis